MTTFKTFFALSLLAALTVFGLGCNGGGATIETDADLDAISNDVDALVDELEGVEDSLKMLDKQDTDL